MADDIRAVVEFAAEYLSSDWPERCQEIVRRARSALAASARCTGAPGECEFNGACMYGCGRKTPPSARDEGRGELGATHRHIKRGTVYTEAGRGKLQTDEPVGDMEPLVAYRGEDGALWFRPVAEFDDRSRFEPLATPPDRAAASPEGAKLSTHDAQVIADIEHIAHYDTGKFWPQALAGSVLRLLRDAYFPGVALKQENSLTLAAQTGREEVAPAGWKLNRLPGVLDPIEVVAPNGRSTVVEREPADILHMLASALLAAIPSPEEAAQPSQPGATHDPAQ